VNRLPDFIIIGAMKCATSTLHEQLARQPGIFMSTPKEPNFFSDDGQFARGIEWYHSLFRDAAAGDLCGESSTHYTKLPTHPRTVGRMAETLVGRVKLIYIMRHPFDRLRSHYVHEWSKQVIRVGIDEAVARHPELIEYGRYGMQLEPYFEAFGRRNILPVFFDRIATAPQDEFERICRFIGYRERPEWVCDLPEQNVSSRRLRRTWFRNLLLESRQIRALARRFVPKWGRNFIESCWAVRVNTELSPDVRRRLTDMFDEDLGRLGRWLGLDLNCRTFREVGGTTAAEWVDEARGKVA
jgi:hypothetical protein